MPTKRHTETSICMVNTSEGPILVPYFINRSRRARYIRLSFNGDSEAVLTIPRRVSEREAMGFLKEQGDWLKGRFGKVKKRLTLFPYLEKNPHLSAHGKAPIISFRFVRGPARMEAEGKHEVVRLALDPSHPIEIQLVELLKAFAKKTIRERVLHLARGVELEPARVTVRDQWLRWGSCSEGRALSLNWRLILLPPELHDYIIFHELAHLVILNHSEDYWKLLKRFDPRALRHDKRVSRMAPMIMSLGRL